MKINEGFIKGIKMHFEAPPIPEGMTEKEAMIGLLFAFAAKWDLQNKGGISEKTFSVLDKV